MFDLRRSTRATAAAYGEGARFGFDAAWSASAATSCFGSGLATSFCSMQWKKCGAMGGGDLKVAALADARFIAIVLERLGQLPGDASGRDAPRLCLLPRRVAAVQVGLDQRQK